MYDIKELCVVPPPYGGASVYVFRLINKLTIDGFTVGGYYSDECNNQSVINSNMFHKWTWMQTSKFPIKIWKYFFETINYRIVHSHFSLEGMVYLWFIKTFGRKKVIVTIHNSMNVGYYNNTNPVNKFFLNKMLRSKDVVWITVSEEGKQQLLSLPVPPKSEIIVIPAYIPIQNNKYDSLNNNINDYIRNHTKIIAFYGHSFMLNNGVDVYGFETIIKCFAILKKQFENIGLIMCIADASDEENLEKLHDFAKENFVDDDIYWQVGAIENIRSLWNQVDVYVRPTSTDGDSVAVREVLDEGVAVVASDVCKRPAGVLIYHYADMQDLCNVMQIALLLQRGKSNPNFEYYIKMKSIYQKLLAG